MNNSDARSKGHTEGIAFQRLQALPQQEYAQHGRTVAQVHWYERVIRSSPVEALFLSGWDEAYQSPQPEKPSDHFESRFGFCTCPACQQEEQKDTPQEAIPEGLPFQFRSPEPPVAERQIPGQRNALRIEMGYFAGGISHHCQLQPLDDTAMYARRKRALDIERFYAHFGPCAGTECRSCPIAQAKFPKLGFVLCTEKQWELLQRIEAFTTRGKIIMRKPAE